MWHNTLVEDEVNIGALRTETSPKLGQSLEEDSHVSIVGNLVVSKGIVDTLSRIKASLMMLNLEKFLMIRTLQPLQPVRKSFYSSVNKLV